MPNIKSQIARVKTNNKAAAINTAKESRIKTCIKKFKAAMTAGTADDVMFKSLISDIDSACSDGIFHKNTASRKVATLSKNYDAYKAAKNA